MDNYVEQIKKLQAAVDWYSERARDAARYMSESPPNLDACIAVITELALDGGRRGR